MDRATLAGPTRNSQPAAAPEEHIPTAVSQAMARASDAALSIATRVEAVADVLKYGFLRDAGAFLAPFADAPEAVELGGFCERLLAGEALLADLSLGAGLERRKCVSIMVALAPGARRTVMVFSGIAAVPFPLNFGFFHLPRDCNFVFLSDPTRRFLLTRTPGLGDTYEATLASVGRVLAGLDTAAVFAMGLSSGGYPALRLGLDLGGQSRVRRRRRPRPGELCGRLRRAPVPLWDHQIQQQAIRRQPEGRRGHASIIPGRGER